MKVMLQRGGNLEECVTGCYMSAAATYEGAAGSVCVCVLLCLLPASGVRNPATDITVPPVHSHKHTH